MIREKRKTVFVSYIRQTIRHGVKGVHVAVILLALAMIAILIYTSFKVSEKKEFDTRHYPDTITPRVLFLEISNERIIRTREKDSLTKAQCSFYRAFGNERKKIDYDLARLFAEAHGSMAFFQEFATQDAIDKYLLENPGTIALSDSSCKSKDNIGKYVTYRPITNEQLFLVSVKGRSKNKPVFRNLPAPYGNYGDAAGMAGKSPEKARAAVAANSPYLYSITNLVESNNFILLPINFASPHDLVNLLLKEEADFIILVSSEWSVLKNTHKNLRAEKIGRPLPICWKSSARTPKHWERIINGFFTSTKNEHRLKIIEDRYSYNLSRLDHLDIDYFMRRVKSRLQPLLPIYKQAARKTDQPWELIAALSYQESQWDHKAVSSTGARGLMMINEITARQLKISLDGSPQVHVMAGARYLKMIRDSLKHIPEPDRTLIALAGYNMGPGRLSSQLKKISRGLSRSTSLKTVAALDKSTNQSSSNSHSSNHSGNQQSSAGGYNDEPVKSQGVIVIKMPLWKWQSIRWLDLYKILIRNKARLTYAQPIILTERVKLFQKLLQEIEHCGYYS